MGGLLILGVLIAWFMTAKWLAGQATHRMAVGIPRYSARAVLTAVLFVAPVADEILGVYQFEALCATGGVYQIAPEAQGKKFDLLYGSTPNKKLTGYVRPVEEMTITYTDVTTDKVVASAKAYVAHGGWLVRTLGFSTSSTSGPLMSRSQCFPGDVPEQARRQQAITNKILN